MIRALTVGDKSGLSRDIKAGYRKIGAAHLLALSGLHVGIIYKLMDGLLFFLSGSFFLKRLKSCVILVLIWAFVFMSGFSSSIAWAAVMITVYEISVAFHTGKDGLTSLGISALMIAIFNPESPRQLSFQLSFCACLAIFSIYPRLSGRLATSSRLLRYVWQSLSLAIACQIGPAPLSLLVFGTFPRYFMVTNLLTVPLVGGIMYLAAASLALYPFVGPDSFPATLLTFAVRLLNYIVTTVANL